MSKLTQTRLKWTIPSIVFMLMVGFTLAMSPIASAASEVDWIEVQPNGASDFGWYRQAISDNGQVVAASTFQGRLYVSTNGGTTWNEAQPAGDNNRNWSSIAISGDGTKILAGVWDAGNGRLYRSVNSGQTWAEVQPGGDDGFEWRDVTMSQDGLKMYAVAFNGLAFRSTNGGNTWQPIEPAGNAIYRWWTISTSDDGNTLVIGANDNGGNNGRVYVSQDSGDSWSQVQPAGDVDVSWVTSNVSGDGTVISAGIENGATYLSLNGGQNWSVVNPDGGLEETWNIHMDTTGDFMFAVGEAISAQIYYSDNSGGNWSVTQPVGDVSLLWHGGAMTRDGSRLVAGTFGGRLHVGYSLQSLSFQGGDGSVGDPYQIGTCEQLQAVGNNLSAHYVLTGQVDCSDTINWNGGMGFNPIGGMLDPFTGTFNGQGYTISSLFMDRADDSYGNTLRDEFYVGLFANAQGATIENLSINNTRIRGYYYVGGIVGYAEDVQINDVGVNVGVAENNCSPGYCVWARHGFYGGGIAGFVTDGSMFTNVEVGGSVKGSGNTIGGIAGYSELSSLDGADVWASVDGGTYIGGVFGELREGTAVNAYAHGNVYGNEENEKSTNNVGGFAGNISLSEVSDSGASGDVIAEGDYVGGFAGQTSCQSVFTNVYSDGSVTGEYYVGGISGQDGCQGPGSDFINATSTGSSITGSGYVGGLIGSAQQTEVYDSSVSSDVVGDDHFVGGAFGFIVGAGESPDDLDTSVIGDVYASGSVTGTVSTGGFVGGTESYDSAGIFISESSSTGAVSGLQYVGGFAGLLQGGDLSELFASGNVTATESNAGGFAGEIRSVGITDSYARGGVEVNDSYAGGFAGTFYGGIIYSSYATGPVSVTAPSGYRAGGFAGEIAETSGDIEIIGSFAAGSVSAGSQVGGFGGNILSSGIILQSNYYDASAAGTELCSGDSPVTEGCVGVNTDGNNSNYFIGNNTNAPLDYGWDFDVVWIVDEDSYPCLRWQEQCLDKDLVMADEDEDGVPDAIENGAPNNGDGNADGTLDSEQGSVVSLINSATGKYVTIGVGDDNQFCTIDETNTATESAHQVIDSGYNYSNGFVGFEVFCAEDPGFSTPVTVIYHGVSPEAFVLRKYNPNTSAYFTVSGSRIFADEIDGSNVTVAEYVLTDGGVVDIDGEANGEIIDPVGLGVLEAGVPNTGLKKL